MMSRRGRMLLWVGLCVTAAALWWWLRRGEVAPEEAVGGDAAGQGSLGERGMRGPGARPARVAAPLKLARASIAGTIRDPQGRAIAGAQVCAWALGARLASSESRTAHCSTSERDGAYRIEGLLGVRHKVGASAPTFIPGPYFRGEGAGRREWVELRVGQELREVDITLQGGGVEIFGVVKDLSGGAIEGAQVTDDSALVLTGPDGLFSMWVKPGSQGVWARAEGYAAGGSGGLAPGHHFELFLTPEAVLIGRVVRAADGAPVEGAQVMVGGGWGSHEGAALSDAGGHFRLDGLKPGAYKARAESDELMGLADEQVILGLGETSAPIVIKAHPSFLVEGKIVSDDGTGCDAGSLSLEDHVNSRATRAQTEADGLVRARGLLPGEFEVQIRCTGKISAERYERVTIADKSVSGLRWAVTGGRTIRGLVVDAGGKGVEGLGVGASAKADPSQPRAQQTSSWSGRSDAAGRFELTGLLPGEYEVSAWNSSRATPERPTPVSLAADRDVEGLRIVLPATGELKGTVRDPQGRALSDIEVKLQDGKRRQRAQVADDGSFRVEDVAPGEYRVTASRNWTVLRAPGTGDDDVQGEKVSIREGEVETLHLVVAGAAETIVGVVRDADGGPVADAFIEATLESDSAAASGGAARGGRWASFWGTPHLSDVDGRFTLTALSPGKHTLRAHRKGGGEGILEHVEAGSDVVLTIAGTGRMAGTVVLRGGGAPEDFTVSVEDQKTGFRRGDSFFRTSGAWSLPELPAGTFKVRVGAGGGSAEIEATMRAGEDLSGLRIELAPKVTVRGTVLDLEGAPAPGLTVYVSDGASGGWGDEQKLNITDDAGRYEVTQAPTGKVSIGVYPQNWIVGSGEYNHASVPMELTASGSVIEVPPIRVSKRRLKEGDAAGDLGYRIKEAEPGEAPQLRRIVIAVVRPGGPAAAAGLLAGDEIVSVDGIEVRGANSYLYGGLAGVGPGTVLSLGLARGASVQVTAGVLP